MAQKQWKEVGEENNQAFGIEPREVHNSGNTYKRAKRTKECKEGGLGSSG